MCYVNKHPLFHRMMSLILCALLLLGMIPFFGSTAPVAHAATTNQLNIVARADYLYNIKWTAQTTCYGWNYNYTFYQGSSYRIPYGQPINSGYYVGFGVDVDTFVKAANTYGSIFYTSRSTYGSTSSLYYATDCSAFVSWCWGTSRKTTYSIPQVSTYLGMATQANTSILQVGDALNSNDVGHVVLVTDLVYNSSGALTSIEITEQTPPQLKRTNYTPYELGAKYGGYYGIYRYYGTVPAAPDGSTGSVSGGNSGGSTTSGTYYPACSSSQTTFYAAMSSIGISVDWDLHTRIAHANGYPNFSGTADENEALLALLKAGKLINPDASSSGDSSGSGSVGDSVVDGKTGYDRGYAGGMAGTGEYKAFGLDVSSWQGSALDFNRIKNGGYDYVILRAGTTNGKDTLFETYYNRAKAAGLDVGAYYYSYATSVSAVKADMQDFLSYIEGKTFEYPIYFDYEDATQQALSASTSQSICLTAMDMLAAEGYLVGMYTGKYFSTQLPMSTICARYEAWIAHYLAAGNGSYNGTYDYTTYGPSYSTKYGMYQFTDSVWVSGYGPYDGDVCYKDYPAIVKKYGFNGYAPEGSSSSGGSGGSSSYIDGCTFYPSHVQIKVTEDTYLYTEPRTAKTGNTSEEIEAVKVGDTLTTLGIYQNTGDNIWYQVKASNGEIGYIYSGRVEYVKKVYSDIKLTDYDVPNGHVKGNIFNVTGTIKSSYNTIKNVAVSVYSGFGTGGTKVTGGSASVSNNKYTLGGSTVDDATAFNTLSNGNHTYVITADYESYIHDTTKTLKKVSGTRTLKKAYFVVIPSAVSQSSCSHSNSTTVLTAATCTKEGSAVVACSKCGLVSTTTLAKTSHSYGSYTTTKAATCTTDGTKSRTCTACGDVNTATIAATGHSWKAATCSAPKTCATCGTTSGSTLSHSYVDGICGNCGSQDPDYDPVVAPEVSAKGFTLSFEDEILVNLYYTISDLSNVSEYGVLMFKDYPSTIDYAKADAAHPGKAAGSMFISTTDGIAAKEMGDTRYYCAYAKLSNGAYAYSTVLDYSPKQYALNQLVKSNSAELKVLCVAMLNYGAAAQSYFGYRTDDLMNAGLTAEQKALVGPYDSSLFAGAVPADSNKVGIFAATNSGFGGRGNTVSFEGAFSINYYYKLSGEVRGDLKMYVWTPEDYAATNLLTADNASAVIVTEKQSNGLYWQQVSGIAAKNLDKTYYVAAVYTDSNGVTHCTGVVPYSLSRYCMNNAYSSMGTLAQAAAMYGYYAAVRFG